jgi:predicted metal-dependent hydrolase
MIQNLFAKNARMTAKELYHSAIITNTLDMTNLPNDCAAPLHPQAAEGLRLFNAGEYFEAHEALEIAWNEERGGVRDLYRGILQIAVVYLHITRGNYNGAVKVYGRSQKWMKDWPEVCRGIQVEDLRRDAAVVMQEVLRLGEKRLGEFNFALLKPIRWEQSSRRQKQARAERQTKHICDRCGSEMHEHNCKVTCPNCGNRFDCSDLNIYFD